MAGRRRGTPAALAALAALGVVLSLVTQVRSQVYVTEPRHSGSPRPSAPEAGQDRGVSSQTASPDAGGRSRDSELMAGLDRLQLLDARLSQMDVLDKMFQFVQLDTNMARISAQVDRMSERLAEQTSRPATCSPAGGIDTTRDRAAMETRFSVLEKTVEDVASRMDSQLGRLHRQLDALLERNVQLNTKADTMRDEMSQLLAASNIVDDHMEQTDSNLKYLRDELDLVKQRAHNIHHQQHKSETALKEEVAAAKEDIFSRLGDFETVLKALLVGLMGDLSQVRRGVDTLQQQQQQQRHLEAPGLPSGADRGDYDLFADEDDLRVHPLEEAEFRAKLVDEIRRAVAEDYKKALAAAGCHKRRERPQADMRTAGLLKDLQATVNSSLEQALSSQRRPADCSEMLHHSKRSGVFTIYPNACSRGHKMEVYCDMETTGGGWTVIQRRGQYPDRSQLDFYQDWSTYKWGFGNISEQFYLGNELIHLLTGSDDFVLRVELEDFSGDIRYAEYEHFSIDGDTAQYRLHVGQYTGNAGDAMSYHNGLSFTTRDQEHDTWPGKNCATHYQGGWWFGSCHKANLNGIYLSGSHSSYGNGIIWYPWRGYYYSLKSSRMMVRPRRVHEAIPSRQR